MRIFSSVYVLLLAYIVVALAFWELSLQKQSGRIFSQEVITLKNQVDSAANPTLYNEQYALLQRNLKVRTIQYIGEGSTFLIVILIGAAVVYNSFRRRFQVSRQQNNFMLSVTHELKSPIAAMKLNLQTLEKHRLEQLQQQHLLGRCITEANRLNDLCNNILFASQLEGGAYKAANETFNFSEMAEEAVEEYGNRYPQRLMEEIEQGIKVTGDKVMLRIMVNNLLENAIKYTPEDKPVLLSLEREDGMAKLQVIDEGAGIADIEKKKIFTKFYRIGNEESRASKGTGLGLYMVQKIIRQHKGTVSLLDNIPMGSIFEVCIPAQQQNKP